MFDHVAKITASNYVPVNKDLVPTGKISVLKSKYFIYFFFYSFLESHSMLACFQSDFENSNGMYLSTIYSSKKVTLHSKNMQTLSWSYKTAVQ